MGTFDIVVHYEWLFRIAMYFTKNVEEAKDLRHDTVLRALRKQHLFVSGSLRAWLYTIMHNIHINNFHKKIKDDNRAIKWYAVDRSVTINKVPDAVWKAIDTLSKKQRDVLFLRYKKGLKHTEIATILGIPKNMSASHAFKGLAHLRRKLNV